MDEYILSTLLRCPECGSPLYGAVNRTKKRADGTPYDPYYYYKCKHQFGQTGHSCSFKTQIGARKIDQEVRDIIMSLVASDKFKSAVYAKIGEAVDTDDIQKQIDTLAKKKRKIENALKMRSIEKDNLNFEDKHYERKYLEISDAMERLYDELVATEDDIDDKKSCIRSVEQNKVSQDKIYNLLIKFSDIYDKMKDQEKKQLMALFIDKIEIHKQKQSDGRRVKQIDFHFPVVIGDGEECNSIFPSFQTNVETVVLLSQQRPNDKIRVELDLTEFDITAAEKEATYQEIKNYILEKHGVKVSSLYISQTKRKCGLDVGDSYNKPKSEDAHVPQCPPEKENAIMDALKHYGII